jgi:hypothetical protein
MNTSNNIHQHTGSHSKELLINKSFKSDLLKIAILAMIVFFAVLSAAQADMVFDFQMKLAQKGNAEAQFKVGEMYEAGRGVEKNMEEAMKWINKAAAQGNQAAGYKLLYYDLEKNGVTSNNKAQLDELKTAADAGDGYAQYYVGLMHSRGVGLKQDSNKALDWLGKATLVGVTAAEPEITRVNEARQQELWRAKQEAERRAREQEEAKRAEEQRKKLEAKQSEEERKRKQAEARKNAEQQKQLAEKREAERKAAENEARKQRLIAQREAEAEEKRQAVMEQRKQKEVEKKAQFESDPCSGKSARFLSTCR